MRRHINKAGKIQAREKRNIQEGKRNSRKYKLPGRQKGIPLMMGVHEQYF